MRRSGLASHVERQFWLAQRLAPDSRAYHVASVFRLRGDLDAGALRAAFQDLVDRHAALRTTFEADGTDLWRVLEDRAVVAFDEAAGPVAPDGAEIAEELRRPFDLARGPLCRVRLWRSGPECVLAWTMHHVITDLRTRSLLAAEVAASYAARRGGPHAAPPPILAAAEYATSATREREWLAGDAARRAERYFQEYLSRPLPALALATRAVHAGRQPHDGARALLELGPSLTGRVERAAAEWQTRPFLVLLTAWGLLLARHVDEERMALGVPFTNRRSEWSHDAVGCFVNTLPIVVDRGGDPTFLSLLRQVRAAFLGHHRHQELPLERLVALSGAAREPGRNPLYQAGFTFEPPVALALPGLEVEHLDLHAGGAQLDLFLTLWRAEETFRGHLEYRTDLYGAGDAGRWLARYETLLESVLEPGAADAKPVSRLGMLDPTERERVVSSWNATDVPRSGPQRLDALVLQQAARTPDAPAVSMGDRGLTYRELARRAGALARELRSAGVGEGSVVGVHADRSLEMHVAMLATILAGGAYLPLEPELPPARIRLMLEDARPSCILTEDRLAGSLAVPGVPVRPLRLDALDASADPEPAPGAPDAPAYLIFTSGSTGRPKGVLNSHRGIANRLLWMQEAFALDPSDVVLQKTPIGFDVSVWELFWPLCVGARLELAPPGAHRDPGALAAAIRRAGATVVHFVPSMLRAFLEHPDAAACRTVRRVVCSGEALAADLVRRCLAILPCELENLYGPTEAAVDVSWWRCRADLARDPVPIGRPIANTRLYVLERGGAPAPIGVAGELFVGGVQVALGYVNRPDLTRERFVPDPFSKAANARMYRTGDRARWDPDGTLVYLGRLDDQLKVRGVRIEPAEIEATLREHPLVRECAVTAQGAGAAVRLVGFASIRGPVAPGMAETLRAHLAERLSPQMMPDRIVLLDELPSTPSGKTDRGALRAMPLDAPPQDAAPADDVQRLLVAELGDLLGGAVIGVRENVFDAGATSLTVAQLVGRIRARLGVDLPVAQIFQHPTIEALAAHLVRLATAAAAPPDPLAAARERARRRARLYGGPPEGT